MAEDFIEQIYSEAILLTELKQTVELIRQRNSHTVTLKLNDILPQLGEIVKQYITEHYEKGVQFWNALEKVSGFNGDLIWLGDCIESEIIPMYQEYLSLLCDIDVDDETGIRMKSSKSVFLSMLRTDNGKYFHSMEDPMWEAYIQAKQLFDPEIRDYYFLGTGLGYLPYQVYLISEKSAKIHIFEPISKFVQYGKLYGVLDWIPEEKLSITVSNDLIGFLKEIEKSGKGYFISQLVTDYYQKEQQAVLEELIQSDSTSRLFRKTSSINYCNNIKRVKNNIDCFNSGISENCIVVAAGPSLDSQMDYLRNMQGKKMIISVGTVFSKLMKAGIRPDAVAIMDPQERTLHQIDGLQDETVPMFIATTAYHGFAENYKGDKYLVHTKGEADICRLHSWPVEENSYFCGSTVMTLAVRCALILNAREIELVGVDLAYPGENSHAKDTMDYEIVNKKNMILVEATNGGKVYSTPAFIKYIYELEDIIKENKKVKFINGSDIGAKIKGTIKR